MNMEWAVVIIGCVGLGALAGVISEFFKSRSKLATDEANARITDQYRSLVSDYESLARETRDMLSGLKLDVAQLQKKVDLIEKILKEVG